MSDTAAPDLLSQRPRPYRPRLDLFVEDPPDSGMARYLGPSTDWEEESPGIAIWVGGD